MNVSSAARAFAGDIEETREIFERAISHRGFALVDVFQPCVTYNRVNTYQWFLEHTYYGKSWELLHRRRVNTYRIRELIDATRRG